MSMTAAQPAPDLTQARQYFCATRNRIVEATRGLSDAQWQFKPAPDRWSIGEIVEHMVTVEERVLNRLNNELTQAPPPPADRDWQKLDAIILERIPDRSNKAKAPEIIEPTGTWTLTDALSRVFQNYERLSKFIESTSDLREHILDAPPIKFVSNGEYTTADGYQWALTGAAHDERHVRQIEEVKAHPAYPAQ